LTKRTCPKCKSKNLAKFLYGLPLFNKALEKGLERKKTILGGCSTDWNSPDWRCNDCGHRWQNDSKLKEFISEIGRICPECDGKNIAFILWGYPSNLESMEVELSKKEIVLGGCMVTDHDPKWECNECLHRWGKRDDD
jgi:hypothetical protein